MTRGVVFDLDGTLIDSLPDIAAAANALLADHGLDPLPQAQIGGFVGMGERVFLDRLIAATALEADQFDPLLAEFITHYKASTGRTRVFPGAIEAVQALRAEGIKVGICTNKPGGPLAAVLDAVDLTRWFDAIIAGDTLSVRKPDPAPLRLAFERMGATEGVYVGDSDVDAETAQRAGVPFAFFTEGIRTKSVDEIPHDRAFERFEDVPSICRDLMRPI
ncbi:phosphoglycolate phosphatase [uncultured Marivita sp.]|uniref:phosphoglycolate phosphatase n=1 Tax=uncultured Marivita sp. TaxID=888080 RepID=UPI002603AB9A|nr:phosphoglycolate phosphatase [uncultured Marivita sp.]